MEEWKGLETLLARSLHLFKESYYASKLSLPMREKLQRTRQQHALFEPAEELVNQFPYIKLSFVCKTLCTQVWCGHSST